MNDTGTTTASVIANALLDLLAFLSDIVFQWLPATLSVLLGQPIQVPVTPESDGQMPPVTPSPPTPVDTGESVVETVGSVWDTLMPVLIFISLLLMAAIIYASIRFVQVNRVNAAAFARAKANTATASAPQLTREQQRWQRILEQAASENENDWRLAILEADIMLDEMLEARGYIGEGVGERLKRVDPADLRTLDMAWEAHKVRNDLAHRGGAVPLNNRETQRVITLFENVFRELRVI